MDFNEARQARLANKRTHLSEAELFEICELARKTDVRDWAIIALGFNHGLRVSELAGGAPANKDKPAQPPLRLVDINWKEQTLTARRLKGSLTTTQPLVNLRGNPTMSGAVALKEYMKVRIDDGSGLVFTGLKGSMVRRTLTKMFRRYCEQVSKNRVERGLEPIRENAMSFHSLKHSCATMLASKVSNIFIVKSYLGHASISSTMQYCAPDQRISSQEAKQVFSQAFSMV